LHEGTKVVAGLAEGGLGREGPEDEEPEGALEGEEAFAAVGAGFFRLEEAGGKEGFKEELDLRGPGGRGGAEAAAEGGAGTAE